MCACPSEIAKGDRNCGGLLHNDGRKVKMVWSWDGACVLTLLKEFSKSRNGSSENALRAQAPHTACCATVPQRLRKTTLHSYLHAG